MQDEEELSLVLNELVDAKFSNLSGPATEEAIAIAERQLGLAFPRDYRVFLRLFGAAQISSLNIFGIPYKEFTQDDLFHFYEVVDYTLNLWEDLSSTDQSKYRMVYFATDEGDFDFFFDLRSVNREGNSPVMISGAGFPLQTFAYDFLTFLRLICQVNPYENLTGEKSKNISVEQVEDPHSRFAKPTRSGLFVQWIQLVPEPLPPDLPIFAQFFGVEPNSRDVFVYAPSADLDLGKQLDAFTAGAGFFWNPTGAGDSRHPYVSIEYLIANHPELGQTSIFPKLRQIVLNAYDGQRSGDD